MQVFFIKLTIINLYTMWKKVKVRKNGQITIPAKIRKKLGIKEGDILEIEVVDGKIVLTPLPKSKDS